MSLTNTIALAPIQREKCFFQTTDMGYLLRQPDGGHAYAYLHHTAKKGRPFPFWLFSVCRADAETGVLWGDVPRFFTIDDFGTLVPVER